MRIHSLLLPNNISIFQLIWLNSWLHFLPFLRGAEEEGEAEAEAEAIIHQLIKCLLWFLWLLLIILYVKL